LKFEREKIALKEE
jgi:hypothetical protein